MARAEIYLEDAEDGGDAAAVRFVFPDGFDAKSSAHQLANILRCKLDEMAVAGELTALNDRVDQGDMFAADEALAALHKEPAKISE